MPVYDDEEQKVRTGNPGDDELRRLTGIGPDEEGAMDREAHNGAAADIAEKQGLFNKTGDDARENNGEQGSESEYGPSAADDIKDRVGKGYRGGNQKKSSLSGASGGKSKLKKRLAIAGLLAGGGLVASILIFFLMLPLKIESLVTNLDNHFGAASSQAMDDESANLLSNWIRRDIIGNLNKGACRSTISSGCVTTDPDTGPVGKLYNAWRQGKVEQKLASKYDIVLGKKGGNYYIAFPQGTATISDADMKAFQNGKIDIFTAAENNPDFKKQKISRAELRQTIKTSLKAETLSNRVYDRFQLGRYMEKKYGIKRCIIACDIRDKFTDSKEDKKKFAKSVFIERVIQPLSENYAFLANCIIQGGAGDCGTGPDTANSSDNEKTFAGERKVQSQSVDLAAKIGVETADELAKKASVIADEGLQKYLVRSFVTTVIDFLAGKGAGTAAGDAATKAIPVVGWALLIGQFAHAAQTIGPMIQFIGYAIKSTAAVQTYYMYASAGSEMKSGHVDATELGSLSSALGSNMSGSADDKSDATSTPLYQQINGTSNQNTSVAFSGSASAATTTTARAGSYLCNDGKPPTDVVCPEENLASGNDVTNKISGFYHDTVSQIPGADQDVAFVNFIANVPGDIIGKILHIFQAGKIGEAACYVTPGCRALKSVAEKYGGELMTALFNKVIDNPVTDNMSGGRTYDMMAAGADVSKNQSCQVLLGCAKVSDQTAAAIRNQNLTEQQKQFQNESMFARMFSTDTPYSLVSRMALAMPSSAGSARNEVLATLVRNPIGSFGSLLSSFVSGDRAFAATDSSQKDPFGVPQVAYAKVPDDPLAFWNKYCVSGPLGVYNSSANTLDVSAWLNAQQPDSNTGQPMPGPGTLSADGSGTNPCLLIYNSVINNGAKYDASLIPPDDLNNQTSADSLKFTVASYNLLNADGHPTDSRAVGGCNTQGDPVCVKYRSNLQAQFIMGQAGTPQIDILTSQETSPGQFRELTSDLGSSYAAVPDTPEDINRLTNQQNGGTSIIWNTAKFKKVSEGKYNNISNVANVANRGHITAPYVVLNAVGGTQNIYVTSIHYPNSSFPDPSLGDAGTMREAANMTMDWARSVRAKDPSALILIGGDFNDSPAQKLSYCIYTDKGLMQHIYDLQNGKDGQCPSASVHTSDFGGIDNLYVNQDSGLTASDYTHVADTGIFKHASDHTPVYATLSTPQTTSGSKFKIATYNIRVPGQVSHGSGSAPIDQRATRAAKLMEDQNIDIIGFQEIADSTRGALDKELTDFASFPTGHSDGPDKSWMTPIYWRKDRFKKIDQGYIGNSWRDCTGINLCNKNPWVELQDVNTGQKLYVTSTHLLNQPVGGGNGGGPQREASANAIVDWFNKVSSADTPVISVGDYNSDYRPSPDDVDIGKNVNRIPYCIFSKAGLVDSHDAANSNNGYCPSKNASFGQLPYRIDHVYISKAFAGDVTSDVRLNNADTNFISDHNPTIASVNIPGKDSGGATGSASPGKDFVGNDGFGGGSCVIYVEYILNRHSSKYHGGALGNGKDVANSLGRYGYAVDHKPAIHATVSFGTQYADPTFGHVALVAQINKDGSIVVEESNWANPNRYGTHTVPASEVPHLTYAHTEAGWH